ncbi:MAG: hypothetical protein A2504_12235 [Bdellovibrionales bacterium RIFOXYD12_FULL_39_22]|nr:MAG: hypothetical protein A2385_14085 [Bdellovibrionales bacterium RIFOXYB1_FULL_39_21]OFZ42531.1 MAG: hypothetical protein A2485_03595 [Bdellovibrionales bacterium RIFOXYC12_FULL_39_17]OFZ45809.1 MAG: hypothetical protein A2404_02310 [Bdellovibrionales bacterium RIFOXYC1_FULL_39_130]OFZ71907.1 MAG: hypothetical protein A2451_16205 [Bdellovibrionales bacterium RIFOXYC2_FULL_39_8]OFZ74743.1 MAG: hypothetical protein A2560_05240 [Bdellovibrionales bacterium RIFOXYD1_FULL_39_84]OFZ93122.1 MAG:
MIKIIIIIVCVALIGGLFYYSYSKSGGIVIEVGSCMSETNKKYYSTSKIETIYKIDAIKNNQLSISSYNGETWDFVDHKPMDYFKDNETFKYDKIDCPIKEEERKSSNSMNSAIKGMKSRH